MVNMESLEIIRIVPTINGLYIFARFAGATHEYNFYISNEGRMEGKSSSGQWLELSDEATRCLESKVQSSLLAGRGAATEGAYYSFA